MSKLALLFSGQGSQVPGMGLDVLSAYSNLHQWAQSTSKALGYDITAKLAATDGSLNETVNTQPALVFTSLILLKALQSHFNIRVDACSGFSLGEYSALYAAGVFDWNTVFKLIKVRANAMHQAALSHPGKMVAVLGLNEANLAPICHEITDQGEKVSIANLNCPGQIVLSGSPKGIELASERAVLVGAKRVLPINVSGAFHSPLMADVQKPLADEMRLIRPNPPQFPLFMNVTAAPLFLPSLDQLIVQQVVSPVRFEETLISMAKEGITHFLEVGPGMTLTNFVKKTLPTAATEHVGTIEDIERVKGWLIQNEFAK